MWWVLISSVAAPWICVVFGCDPPALFFYDRKMEEQKPKDQRFKANENKPVMNEWALSEQFVTCKE
jgi:hypothetical protein